MRGTSTRGSVCDKILTTRQRRVFTTAVVFVSIAIALSFVLAVPACAAEGEATLHIKIAFANGTFISGDLFTVSLVDSNLQTIDSGHAPYNTKVSAGTYYIEAKGTYNEQLLVGSETITINSSDNSEHYLIVVVTPAPAAIFMADPTSGTAPLTVQFTDGSIGLITAYSWDFGDGTGTSTDRNSSHNYAIPGTYTATLTVTGPGGSDSASTEIDVSPGMTSTPVADFTADVTSGTSPLTVQFSDVSTNAPTTWSWSFGDGAAGNEQNPVHEYLASGVYTVTLTASNAGGSDTETKTNYITVVPPVPVAEFTISQPSPDVPSAVTFTSTSTGDELTYAWNFGGSEGTGTDGIASHVYNLPGTYTVTLIVTDSMGRTSTISHDVTVNPAAPVAEFTVSQPSLDAPSAVTFTSTSTGDMLTYDWNFGGSEGTGTDGIASHTYNTPGTYAVTLIVTDSLGRTDTISHDVTVNPAAPVAGFTVSQPSQNVPSVVTFTSTSTGDGLTYDWNFGGSEGTGTGPSISHTYNSPGAYTVTLTVTDSLGRTSETTYALTVVKPAPVVRFDPTAYSVNEDAGTVTLTVRLSEPADSDVTVVYSTADGTAQKVTDYLEVTDDSVTIAATQDSATFTVPIVDDDVVGGNVYFLVDLLSVSTENAVIDEENNEATVTIVDDETTFTIHLKKGWNMISSPLVIQPFKASEITELCPAISQVMQYDTTGESFSAYLIVISPEEYDFLIETDVGYLVYAKEDADLTFVGKKPVDRSITLTPGWTMAGWSTFSESDAMEVMELMSGRQQIMMYDNPQISFTAYLEGISPGEFNFRTAAGSGYLIFTNTQTTLNFGGITNED